MKRARPNRLALEKSPYLLQHAHNPVDWYPWGDEAFAKAKAENKPIFLSIGYSTCHWCHVMERESFSDSEVAIMLNRAFVCIKVDREERPDVDSYYMMVCQMLSGAGGWPLTVIMSPDKHPFFATTYLPKMSRFGRIGLTELIPQVEDMWRTRQDQIMRSSADISELMKAAIKKHPTAELDHTILRAAYEGLSTQYDAKGGGFGSAPKFPMAHNILFLLRYWQSTGDTKAQQMAEHTLTAMRWGGIYDHIGFGFHRYSTDDAWRLPHFEKMLYDQALLLMAYTEAYAVTRKKLYMTTVHEIIEYTKRDMMSEQGAYYSAEDADSEGQEGKFYVWTWDEIRKILSKAEFDLIKNVFNVQSSGNINIATVEFLPGQNHFYSSKHYDQQADELGMTENELTTQLEKAREKLFAQRSKRIRPYKDTKILCDWNGIMVAALAKAGRILENSGYISIARRAADFILTEMRDGKGGLHHVYVDGESAIPGFLDDYMFLTWGLLELYGACFETEYLKTAIQLVDSAQELFGEQKAGALYFTQKDNELPLRRKESHDGAVPSGNALAMLNMLRLARLTGRTDLERRASAIAEELAYQIRQNPLNHIQALNALNFAFFAPPEIVIVGDKCDALTEKMLSVVNNSHALDSTVLLKNVNDRTDIIKLAPFSKNLMRRGGKTTAYVCKNHECGVPTNDIGKFTKILDSSMRTSKG